MRYIELREWDIDYICNDIRERIAESKKPIPPKIIKHYISIVYKTGENSYIYPSYGLFSYPHVPDFKSRQEAENFMNCISWLKRIGENSWEEIPVRDKYIDNNGNEINCHYMIRESDYEVYEDEESHTEYSDEEREKLSEALYIIEKAMSYIRAYDYCRDQYCFGNGGFVKELKEELDKFEKNFTEELPENEEDIK